MSANASQEHVETKNTRVLAYILQEIGAPSSLQVFVDYGHDDSTLRTVSNLKPDRISSVFSLTIGQAEAFIRNVKV